MRPGNAAATSKQQADQVGFGGRESVCACVRGCEGRARERERKTERERERDFSEKEEKKDCGSIVKVVVVWDLNSCHMFAVHGGSQFFR